MQQIKNPFERALGALLPATVLLLGYELAAGFSFYLLEVSVALMAVAFAGAFMTRFGLRVGEALRFFLLVGENGAPVLWTALLYLGVDFISFLYGPDRSLFWQKYKLVLVMILVSLSILSVRNDGRALKRVKWALAGSGVLICLVTYLNYFAVRIYPIRYTLRLSLRTDYNMFATAVFTGMVLGVFLCIKEGKKLWPRILGASFFLVTGLPVLYLSGSRRIYLLSFPVLAVVGASCLVREMIESGKAKGAAAVLAAALCVGGAGFGLSRLCQNRMEHLYRQEGAVGAPALTGGGRAAETEAVERYGTISDGSLFSKRRVIWGLSLERLGDYDAIEWAVGRGGGYNVKFYDEIGEPLDGLYPDHDKRLGALSSHNMLLADLLDGGAVKLTALAAMLLTTAWYAFLYLAREPLDGLPIGILLGVCVLGSLVSNRFGLLYDRYFYIFAALLVCGTARTGGYRWKRKRSR